MTYQDAAKKIIKEHIKNAIYIDENALEPFEGINGNESDEEEIRSIMLFNSFRKEAITLSVLKYTSEQYTNLFNYIFQNRDLVLLDWELNGPGQGGEKALEILSEIVCNQPHVHFCALYTAEKNKDNVLMNILSYFSNTTTEEYEYYKMGLESNDKIKDVACNHFNQLILHRDKVEEMLDCYADIIDEVHNEIKAESKLCSLIKCAIAFGNLCKSNNKLPCPKSYDTQTYTLIIENTIIQIINKQETAPDTLINSLSENIANYKWGVMQLLGLEMQNIYRKTSSFVSPNVLQVSKKALAYHKKNHGKDFQDFIKSVLIEHNAVILRNEYLSLVDSIEEEDACESDTELIAMNVFYNSTCLNGNKKLSFGDVLKSDNDDYYICITALCDCALPEEKINNSFFFAKGVFIKPSKVLDEAETGFVSFLDDKTAVRWDSNNKDSDKAHYIKPICFTITDNNIIDGKIQGYLLDKNGNRKELEFQYVTTIKQNYTQRIANHTFAYPVRVGVDFVKIAKNN